MSEPFVLKLISYIRGLVFSLRLGQPSLISKAGKIKLIMKHAQIKVGRRTTFWPDVKLSCVGKVQNPAILIIGERCSIGDRTEIHCGEKVEIGNDVLISWDCVIMDRDYHSHNVNNKEKIMPVKIGNNVWISCRSIILKGVQIGEGAVIGAGAVVTGDVEPYSIYAGNPARLIRQLR